MIHCPSTAAPILAVLAAVVLFGQQVNTVNAQPRGEGVGATERVVSAGDAKIKLPGGYEKYRTMLNLGSCEGVGDVPQKFLIKDLPADCEVTLIVCQFDKEEVIDVRFESVPAALGMEKLGVVWRVHDQKETFTAELTLADRELIRVRNQKEPEKWATKADTMYELTLSAVKSKKRIPPRVLIKDPHWLLFVMPPTTQVEK